MTTNEFQDFADRWHEFFGGHFGYLTLMAKRHGVQRCDWIAAEVKEFCQASEHKKCKDHIKLFNYKLHLKEDLNVLY